MTTAVRQRGFGLVEILTAMVIGLLLLGGIFQIFLSGRQSYNTNEAIGRVQENGRFAMDFISRDLRMAGFNPVMEVCGAPVLLRLGDGDEVSRDLDAMLWSYVDDGADAYLSLIRGEATDNPIGGYDNFASGAWNEGDGSVAPTDVKTGTDVLVIRRASSTSNAVRITGNAGAGEPLELAATVNVGADSPLLAMNEGCTTAALFTTGENVSGTEITFEDDLGADMEGGTLILGVGSGIEARDYYISENTLYRRIRNGATVLDTQPLIDNVEDMQVLYAEDTDNDGVVDAFQTADAVSNWNRVFGARVSLLVSSPEDDVLPEAQTLSFNGATLSFDDRRLRQVFTTTIGFRNRLQ